MRASPSRRELTTAALGSAALWALADLVRGHAALAEPARSSLGRWLLELDELGRECRGQKLAQTEWQTRVEALLSGIDLPEFLGRIDFEALTKKLAGHSEKGALSMAVELGAVDGAPARWVFGRQVFGMKKGRSIVPHGHNNMATAFVVLAGTLRGRHYQRFETQPRHLVIAPTIDREFGPGGSSSVSDVKDNVHWFQALTTTAFVFNVHLLGVTPGNAEPTGRVYVDPAGEKLGGGKIRARLVDHDECTRRCG
jgi:hypothetical protein